MTQIKGPLDFPSLISEIRHGKIFNSSRIAIKTEAIIEKIIAEGLWNSAQELMNIIRLHIQNISVALPLEVISTNILRHVLKIIRDEYDSGFKSKVPGLQSLHHLVTSDSDIDGDYSKPLSNLKALLLDHLTEYKVELESSIDNIAAQASEHIHSNEIILTIGHSTTVQKFLKFAAKTRKFQVIVVESAPLYHGHKMSISLSKSKIQTTVITDSSAFAMMSRVNKVIIGTHSILANGGLRASCGAHTIALSAKHYSVPVMVLTHMYKLSPTFVCSHKQDDFFNVCASPADVLPYSSGHVLNKVEIYNPMFDYVPPELVTLFILHQGGNAASYVYCLLSELYHPEDYEL